MFRQASSTAMATAIACCSLWFAATLLPSGAAFAQLDPPALTLEQVDRSSARLVVSAGSSGTPAGFTVQWMTQADHDALGGWPADANHPSVSQCVFDGTPTLTVTPGVPDFALGAHVNAIVEIGDLLDETGVDANDYDELAANATYFFRVVARRSNDREQSAPSASMRGRTALGGVDCLFSQGFWKRHPDLWPAATMRLGTVTYTDAQLLEILDEPARGNGLLFLAHQLIATKLNLGAGANPAPIQATIDAADALIGSRVVPPIGNGHIHPSLASDLTEELDAFNNGRLGSDCNPVATHASAWSTVKGLYR